VVVCGDDVDCVHVANGCFCISGVWTGRKAFVVTKRMTMVEAHMIIDCETIEKYVLSEKQIGQSLSIA
jgi:hypothetical protein